MPPTACDRLTAEELATLERHLATEADMAYRRRVMRLAGFMELEDGLRVLDCGCGVGALLPVLDDLRSMRLVGLDAALERLARGRSAGVPGGLVGADLSLSPFPDGAFDRILLTEVLEHVADDRAALTELFRLLRPGGVLALSVPHADFPFLWDPIGKVWGALGGRPLRTGPLVGIWTGHERLYRPREVVERLQEAGFVTEEVEEATHYAFPFSHFLLYGLGKLLVERRLLPTGLRRRFDRLEVAPEPRSRVGLAGSALWPLRVVDRLNEGSGARRPGTYVNVLVKARRPETGAAP